MKPAPFDLLMAETLDEALAALADHGDDAQIIAGGQSLVPMLNLRAAMPELLVDINRIDALKQIELVDSRVRVGAGVRQRDLESWPGLETHLPMVAQALRHIGHVQTRNRGTVCGSLCHADPAAELPLCLLALRGEVELASASGRRTVKAADFFEGALSTCLEPGEMMVSASFKAARPGHAYVFDEVAERHGDFAIAAFAAVAGPTSFGLALGGVSDTPVARDWDTGTDVVAALSDWVEELDIANDHHASADYRRHLIRRRGLATVQKALAEI